MFLFMLVPIVIFGLLALIVVFAYNNLVANKNAVDAAWAQIAVQLTRRADLVENLVRTVKGYAAHEKTVLEDVTNARAQTLQTRSAGEAGRATAGLDSALSRLFAVVERYPNLKASANFISLQGQLQEIENRLAGAREYYNETVRRYHNSIQSFPANLFASTFGFASREYFEIEPEKTEPPRVNFA